MSHQILLFHRSYIKLNCCNYYCNNYQKSRKRWSSVFSLMHSTTSTTLISSPRFINRLFIFHVLHSTRVHSLRYSTRRSTLIHFTPNIFFVMCHKKFDLKKKEKCQGCCLKFAGFTHRCRQRYVYISMIWHLCHIFLWTITFKNTKLHSVKIIASQLFTSVNMSSFVPSKSHLRHSLLFLFH